MKLVELVSLDFCEEVIYVQPLPLLNGKFEEITVENFPSIFGTRLVLAILKVNQNLKDTDVVIMITVFHKNKEIFNHINRLIKVTVPKGQILPIEIGNLRKLRFTEAGAYDFNFYVEGVLLGTKTLTVKGNR